MNASQPVIQLPPNIRLDRCREKDLRDHMGISQEIFNLFKVGCIRRRVTALKIPTTLIGYRRALRHTQVALRCKVSTKAGRMERVLQHGKVVRLCRNICTTNIIKVNNELTLHGKYVDNWHISAYFCTLRRNPKVLE